MDMGKKRNNTTIESLNNINYLNESKIHTLVFYVMNDKCN